MVRKLAVVRRSLAALENDFCDVFALHRSMGGWGAPVRLSVCHIAAPWRLYVTTGRTCAPFCVSGVISTTSRFAAVHSTFLI